MISRPNAWKTEHAIYYNIEKKACCVIVIYLQEDISNLKKKLKTQPFWIPEISNKYYIFAGKKAPEEQV